MITKIMQPSEDTFLVQWLMQVSFVRRTSRHPGMVRHCTDVRHPFIYHDAPSVRNSDSPFKNMYAYLRQNYDAPFHENDRPMTHVILSAPEWRSYWRTLWRTHGKVTDQDAHMGQCCDYPFASMTVLCVINMAVHDAPFPGVKRCVLQTTPA